MIKLKKKYLNSESYLITDSRGEVFNTIGTMFNDSLNLANKSNHRKLGFTFWSIPRYFLM